MAAKKKTSSKKVKKTANKTNKIKIDDYNEYYSNIISPGFLSDLHAAVCDALNLNIVSSYQINKTLPKKVSTSKNTKSLKKEDISQYIEMFNETLNNCKEKISYAKNSSNDSNLIEKCNILENKIQEQLKNAEVNLSRDIKNTLKI